MKPTTLGRLRRWSLRGTIAAALLISLAGAGQAAHRTTRLLSQPGPTFTVPAPSGSWTLIAYGDMRFTDPGNHEDSNPEARRALVLKIAEERPNILLLSGDVPFHGGNADDYAEYNTETAPWRAEHLHVFPALGNHELYGIAHSTRCPSCLQNWWNTFPELRGRLWYSVRFGDAYIITLDSNLNLMPDGRQSKWLAGQLRHLPPAVHYVFISLHHPPMADPVHGNSSHDVRPNEAALARQLEASAQRLHARIIVIAGHIHAYERFERNGVDYLVSGGGGAEQYRVDRTPRDLYQDNVFPNYHYVKFVEKGGVLHATMYRLDNGRFLAGDSFTVSARAAAAAAK